MLRWLRGIYPQLSVHSRESLEDSLEVLVAVLYVICAHDLAAGVHRPLRAADIHSPADNESEGVVTAVSQVVVRAEAYTEKIKVRNRCGRRECADRLREARQ